MTQHESNSTIPQAVRDLIASKVGLFDQYMLMQTGDSAYTALIRNTTTQDVQQIAVYRETAYNGPWRVVYIDDSSWAYTMSNEYYVYSNVGYGTALDLPVVEHFTAIASGVLACALMLAILFKGVLFPCLLGRKRKDF